MWTLTWRTAGAIALASSVLATLSLAPRPAEAGYADASYVYSTESSHTYGCPPDYDDISCGSDAWGTPVVDAHHVSSATETFSETFTLTGGTGTALFGVIGQLLRSIGESSYANGTFNMPTAVVTGRQAANDYTMRLDGMVIASGSQHFDATHPIAGDSEVVSLDRILTVRYDVPFTLSVTMDSFARMTDVVVDCGEAMHGASCSYSYDFGASQGLGDLAFAIPAGTTLTWTSPNVYPVAAIPEPSSMLLLALGVLVLAGSRRRKRAGTD